MFENDATEKAIKNLPPNSRQQYQNCRKKGLTFHAGDAPKIVEIHKFAKMDPRDVQGSKRHPKGTQKAPKDTQKASRRHPKGIKKPSKRRPH